MTVNRWEVNPRFYTFPSQMGQTYLVFGKFTEDLFNFPCFRNRMTDNTLPSFFQPTPTRASVLLLQEDGFPPVSVPIPATNSTVVTSRQTPKRIAPVRTPARTPARVLSGYNFTAEDLRVFEEFRSRPKNFFPSAESGAKLGKLGDLVKDNLTKIYFMDKGYMYPLEIDSFVFGFYEGKNAIAFAHTPPIRPKFNLTDGVIAGINFNRSDYDHWNRMSVDETMMKFQLFTGDFVDSGLKNIAECVKDIMESGERIMFFDKCGCRFQCGAILECDGFVPAKKDGQEVIILTHPTC